VWLAPPSVSQHMYSYGTDFSGNPASNNLNPFMSNTSRVDVFAPREDGFSEFWEHAVAEASSATLEAGDVLFFPPGWWHAFRAEDRSFSVSMWF
jgi:hypothetical protein